MKRGRRRAGMAGRPGVMSLEEKEAQWVAHCGFIENLCDLLGLQTGSSEGNVVVLKDTLKQVRARVRAVHGTGSVAGTVALVVKGEGGISNNE